MNNKPRKIGITGGIGSGKTLVSKIFNLLGIPVYNADDRAKWLMVNNKSLIDQIRKSFGAQSYTAENKLNREYISKEVFNDNTKLEILNSIVHPAVALDFEKWLLENSTHRYILKEAALLFEAGSYKTLDKIITVFAPVELRLKRIIERDSHRRESDIKAIMDTQLSEEAKITKSDFVIYNDDKTMVIPQVLQLHEKFLSLSYE